MGVPDLSRLPADGANGTTATHTEACSSVVVLLTVSKTVRSYRSMDPGLSDASEASERSAPAVLEVENQQEDGVQRQHHTQQRHTGSSLPGRQAEALPSTRDVVRQVSS